MDTAKTASAKGATDRKVVGDIARLVLTAVVSSRLVDHSGVWG
jgi:hypothetical protein